MKCPRCNTETYDHEETPLGNKRSAYCGNPCMWVAISEYWDQYGIEATISGRRGHLRLASLSKNGRSLRFA